MKIINFILHGIDTINDWVGKIFRWTLVVLAIVMCYEVFARYVFNKPTIWAFEVSTGLFATSFMMCGAYGLLWKTHVIIDILYDKLSLRGKAIMDLFTHAIFFYPFLITVLYIGTNWAAKSWAIKETGWSTFQMPVYLIKTTIPLFAFFCLLQGTATVIRAILNLVTGKLHESRYKKLSIVQAVLNDMQLQKEKQNV